MPEPPTPVVAQPERWTTFEGGSAPEIEVSALIRQLVIALKPSAVVELGTARGETAVLIGSALLELGEGRLVSYEIREASYRAARKRCAGLPVECRRGSASKANVQEHGPVDLLFVDANLDARISDYLRWRPVLRNGAVALLHDTLKFDAPRSQLERIADPHVNLRTPRGLTIVQKRDGA